MGVVMRELDSCLKFRSGSHGLNEELVGTVIEMVELNVHFVVLSVRV